MTEPHHSAAELLAAARTPAAAPSSTGCLLTDLAVIGELRRLNLAAMRDPTHSPAACAMRQRAHREAQARRGKSGGEE